MTGLFEEEAWLAKEGKKSVGTSPQCPIFILSSREAAVKHSGCGNETNMQQKDIFLPMSDCESMLYCTNQQMKIILKSNTTNAY